MNNEEDENPSVREICGELYWAIDVDTWSVGISFGIREDALIIDTAVGVLARHIGETILPTRDQHIIPRPYASHLTPRKYEIPQNPPHGGHTPQELSGEIIHEIREIFEVEGFQLSKGEEKVLYSTTVGILARHVGITLEDDIELPCTPHPHRKDI